MNKYWLITIAVALALTLGILAYVASIAAGSTFSSAVGLEDETVATVEAVHYHAGFQMYIDDKLQDFSGFQYMELKPCTPDSLTEEDTVHLHNDVGDVVHVHHAGMTWSNLAQYLIERSEANLSEDEMQKATVVGYVNGEKVDDILSYPIKAYDSVVVFIGKTTDVEGKLKNAVTIDHIKDIEADKENCGS